jgi:cysteinyl-tRNA synthetase
MKRIILLAAIGVVCSSAFAEAERDWNSVHSWVYQLCGYKDNKLDEIAAAAFDLAVIDLSRDGGEDYFTAKEIGALKESGKIALAYFSIASIETYRPEWSSVPEDLKAGKVSGWPDEQYVKFWDERWWPVVQGRVDQALRAGFDGAYLDMLTTYEEIPGSGVKPEERAHRMVDLIARISRYAKGRNPDFKIVPQNCPELYTWSYWKPGPNQKYIDAIDGLGVETVFYLAHDKPAEKGWCKENRDNALAIRNAGKLVLGVDYARKPESIADSFNRQRKIGFVPYVSVRALNVCICTGLVE